MRVQECDCSVAAIKSQLEKWNDGHMGWEGGEKTAANIHIHPTCETNTVTVPALFPIIAFSIMLCPFVRSGTWNHITHNSLKTANIAQMKEIRPEVQLRPG